MGSFQIFTFIKRVMMNIHIAKSMLGVIPYGEFREIELLFQIYAVERNF